MKPRPMQNPDPGELQLARPLEQPDPMPEAASTAWPRLQAWFPAHAPAPRPSPLHSPFQQASLNHGVSRPMPHHMNRPTRKPDLHTAQFPLC
jgi:hypothetical protein